MSERPTRRGFLLGALAAAGGLVLVLGGVAGRAARRTAAGLRIPMKSLERKRLHEPHDLAG